MKNSTRFLYILSLFCALLLAPHSAQATHFKGGDIYFECMGSGQYRLVFTCYYSCEAGSATPSTPSGVSWDITSTCPGVPTTLTAVDASATSLREVPLYCAGIRTTCSYYDTGLGVIPPGTPDGTLLYKYVSPVFPIPAGCTVTATMTQGNRNNAITNLQSPGNTYIDIEASVTTPAAGAACQDNPQFASFPVNIFCVNENANFSQGAIVLGGDSLSYSLINPRDFGGAPIPFQAGCSATNPLGAPNTYASSFTFDRATGNVNFTPSQTGNYVMAIQVDAYRNGVLVSSTMRDIQILVISCVSLNTSPKLINYFTPATVSGALVYDSTHIGVCPGSHLQFTLRATDQDSFNYIRDSADFARILPGSTYTVTHSGTKYDTTTLRVSWTPQNADSGFHYLYLTVSDTFCPRPGSRVYPFTISVLTGLYAGPNQVYCNGGQPVTIQARGANHYIWTDSATGGPPVGIVSYSADSSSITVAPPVPDFSVGYVVQGDLIGGCKNFDTVSVKNVPKFTLTPQAQDSAICKYTSTTVTALATPASVGPYTYAWGPIAKVVSPTAVTTAITPLISDTWYRVTVSAIGGCVITDSVQVRISGAAPRIAITPSNNNVCPGDTVTLNAIAFAENLVTCGTVDTCPDNTILTNGTVGADTSARTYIVSPYSGTYPYAKTQYLIRASELNAAGLSSGAITDISFFVKELGSSVGYDSFAVSMGCTALDSLTGFVNNLLEVAPPALIFPNSGWSPHPFQHYYNWDGYSNLIVQVCYTRSAASFNQDDYVAYVTTPYRGSSVYARSSVGGNNGCALNSGTVSDQRPIMRVGICAPDALHYQWSPATLVCDTCAVTAVPVPADASYTLTVRNGNCVNSAATNLTINRNIGINAIPDTTICNLDSARLNVIFTNPPRDTCFREYAVTSVPYRSIAGTATTIPVSSYSSYIAGFPTVDDGTAGPFNIGFAFPFYCQSYSNFWANSNAWVSFLNPSFATGGSQYTSQSFPPSTFDANPLKEIALMVGDYTVGAGSTESYFTTGTAPNRICVIKFNNLTSLNGGYTTSGEIHLYEGTGVIEIMLQNSNYALSEHTTGIKDTVGIGIAAPGRNDVPYTISVPEGWRFTPHSGSPVALGTTVWTPNSFLTDDSIVRPLAYPPTAQTYYVDEYLVINQFTNPTTCHVRDSVRIEVASFPHNVTASPLTVCPGDTSRLTFISPNVITSYSWKPALFVTDPTAASTLGTAFDTAKFFVTAIDVNGCRGIDSVTVNVVPTPHPHVSAGITICYTDSVTLTVSGTYSSYQWYRLDSLLPYGRESLGTGSSTIGKPGQSYIVRVLVAGNTCYYFSDTAVIGLYPHPQLQVISSGPYSFCTGSSVILQTEPGYNTYIWTPAGGSGQSVTVQASGDYSYTAKDIHGCQLFSDTAFIRVSDQAQVTIPQVPAICDGDTARVYAVTVPAGLPVAWYQAGVQIASGNPFLTTIPGSYRVVASIGCPSGLDFTVVTATKPTVSLDIPGPINVCGCDTSIVVATIISPSSSAAGATYLWSADSSTASTYGIRRTGTYSVTITDANICTASTSISAILTCPQVTIDALPDTIFVANDTTVLTVTPAAGTVLTGYQWSPAAFVSAPSSASTEAIAQHLGIDTFYVTVTDDQGCTNKVPVYISVIDRGMFQMANAFTPNGDGKNDMFYPILNGPGSTSRVTTFRVYNRWGQVVHDNPDAPGWDGGFKGSPQSSDTYIYFVTVESPDPSDATKKIQKSVEGSFQLFR